MGVLDDMAGISAKSDGGGAFDKMAGIQTNQRDPFSYSPQETEKMRADFVASQGGSVFGGGKGDRRSVVGIASPKAIQSAEGAKQWLDAPTAPATGIVDFATRVVPTSAAKNLKGAFQAPYEMANRMVEPVVNATADYAYGGKGGLDAVSEGAMGAASGAVQNVGDIAKFMGTKTGIIAPDANGLNFSVNPLTVAPRVWNEATSDPVGVGLAMYGGAKTIKGAVNTAADMTSRVGLKNNAELADLSKQHDVPLTAGEQSGSAGLQNAETLLERVPFVGTRGFREMQSGKLADAASNLVERFAPENTADIPDQIQTSMLKTLQEGKDKISGIQEQVNKEVATNALEPITPSNLRTSTLELLDKFPDIFDRLPSTKLKNQLTALAEGTAKRSEDISVATEPDIVKGRHGSTQPEPKVLLDAQGNPIKRTIEPTIGFDEAMRLREMLNDYLSRAYKSAGAVGNKEIYQLTSLKRGLDADINAWGKNSSNSKVVDLMKERNAEYIKKIVPFKDVVVKTATGTAFDTDLLYKKFIQPDRPQLARKLMNSLDEEGQGLVRYAVLQKALEAGKDTKPGVPFSPAKFAREIERLGPTIDAVFPGQDRQLITGFSKLARAAERAGQYAENPPTGLRAGDTGINLAIGAGAIHSPLTTAGSLGTVYALKSLLTTKAGKKILLRASRAPETSSVWGKIIEESNKLIPAMAVGAVGVGANSQQVSEPPQPEQ